MKRAGSKISGIAVFLMILTGLSMAVLVWREISHRRVLSSKGEEISVLVDTLAQSESQLRDKTERLGQQSEQISEMEIQKQSMLDRISNLEAQRDHLRMDNEKRILRTKSLETVIDTLEKELAEARHSILQLEALPEELSTELNSARNRLSGLESELDELLGQLSNIPEPCLFEGASSDEMVFAVSGDMSKEVKFPKPVYLCNINGIIVEGWLHDSMDGHVIGHVMKWHQPASALVKGEKVFILPKKSHEQHN